jgi:hypothetical protein
MLYACDHISSWHSLDLVRMVLSVHVRGSSIIFTAHILNDCNHNTAPVFGAVLWLCTCTVPYFLPTEEGKLNFVASMMLGLHPRGLLAFRIHVASARHNTDV